MRAHVNFLAGLTVFLTVFLGRAVYGVTISADLTPLGGNWYRYTYTVTHDGSLGSAPLQVFDLSFDTASYLESSLRIVSPPAITSAWNEIILGSVLAEPAAYSSFASASGIAAGQSVSGFAVEFQWTGAGSPPASQRFQIFDANSFAMLEQGTTRVAAAIGRTAEPVAIPTLSEWGMIWLGLVLAAMFAAGIKNRALGAN